MFSALLGGLSPGNRGWVNADSYFAVKAALSNAMAETRCLRAELAVTKAKAGIGGQWIAVSDLPPNFRPEGGRIVRFPNGCVLDWSNFIDAPDDVPVAYWFTTEEILPGWKPRAQEETP